MVSVCRHIDFAGHTLLRLGGRQHRQCRQEYQMCVLALGRLVGNNNDPCNHVWIGSNTKKSMVAQSVGLWGVPV